MGFFSYSFVANFTFSSNNFICPQKGEMYEETESIKNPKDGTRNHFKQRISAAILLI